MVQFRFDNTYTSLPWGYLRHSGNSSGQDEGSSTICANSTARHAASGLRAHHRCSVEGCPCRIDFSRAEAALISANGNATSMSFLRGAPMGTPFNGQDRSGTAGRSRQLELSASSCAWPICSSRSSAVEVGRTISA